MANHMYIHGTVPTEQQRLLDQANFLSPYLYRDIDFSNSTRLLELGCGVGAQTRVLLQRWPHLHITGVDVSAEQLSTAKSTLAAFLEQKSVELVQSDGAQLPFDPGSFDSLFLCWILEHVPSPLDLLISARRVLRPSSWVVATEVLNSSLVLNPMGPLFKKIWTLLNELQLTLGGNPDMGKFLGEIFQKAGYRAHKVRPISFVATQAQPFALRRMVGYWTDLMCSALPAMVQNQMVDKGIEAELRLEMDQFLQRPDAFFHYACIQWEGFSL
jgi:ubiquinone/menaquinone biosynthesis C-methylase UbiE